REVRRERIRQTEHRRELGTEERRAEDVERHVRPLAGCRVHTRDAGFAAQVRLEFEDVLREVLRRHVVAAQRPHRRLAAPGSVAGEWFGSITPPAPRRIVEVCAATWAIRTLVAEEAIESMLWCSAYQTRS